MDYIQFVICIDVEFCQMWVEFEWENKVIVNINMVDLNDYLQYILKLINMKCLILEKVFFGYCGFMVVNFYVCFIFGEDVFVNVSIEKLIYQGLDVVVIGYIRICVKSQGMVLSFGDKINLLQKKISI